MTKKKILKNAMSVPYCGETRFDFLDEEELPLIYQAMEEYSKNEAKKRRELESRLSDCRDYLMSTARDEITVEDALEQLGFGRNGLKFE